MTSTRFEEKRWEREKEIARFLVTPIIFVRAYTFFGVGHRYTTKNNTYYVQVQRTTVPENVHPKTIPE